MFQLERLKVVAETIDQIAEEIEAGNMDDLEELSKATNTVAINGIALNHLVKMIGSDTLEVKHEDS